MPLRDSFFLGVLGHFSEKRTVKLRKMHGFCWMICESIKINKNIRLEIVILVSSKEP